MILGSNKTTLAIQQSVWIKQPWIFDTEKMHAWLEAEKQSQSRWD